MTATSGGLRPDLDGGSAPFWAGLRRRVITVQKCGGCAAVRYPPLPGCPECLDREAEWIELAASGTVWSYAVYHRALQPAFADEVPYTVAVVELDDGPRVTARLTRGSAPITIGARVVAEFEDIDAELTQLRWRLA